MTTLSIVLPDKLAKASQEVAYKLGVSRTQFIRQAIARELEHYKVEQELEAIAQSFAAMKKSKSYAKEADDLMEGFGSDLTEDKSEWWLKKKKS